MRCIALTLTLQFLLLVPGSEAASSPKPTPIPLGHAGFQALFQIAGPDLAASFLEDFARTSPAEAQHVLTTVHRRMPPDLFSDLIRTMARHPVVLRRFIDASVLAVNPPLFQKLMADLATDPDAVRAVTYESLIRLSDDEMIRSVRVSAAHPETLKLFVMELDERVLSEFTKQALEDLEAFTALVSLIQQDPKRLQNLAPGVDLTKVTESIVRSLDQSYFRELLTPTNPNSEAGNADSAAPADDRLLFLGLSLADGIIDLPGQEKIDLDGVTRQALKVIDDPTFLFAFLWNMIAGERSSQHALRYRRALFEADEADGKKDNVVDLRALYAKEPKRLYALHESLIRLLNIPHFRKSLSDPDLLMDPIQEFLLKHEASVVAKTLQPLFVRSVEIRPGLSKVILRELPPPVIGAILNDIVDQFSKTQEGRAILKRLLLTIWRDIPSSEIQRLLRLINTREPIALYELIVPIVRSLSPAALAETTRIFASRPAVFHRYVETALTGLPPTAMSTIAAATTGDRNEFYRLIQDWARSVPRQSCQAVLSELGNDPAFLAELGLLFRRVPAEKRAEAVRRFRASGKASWFSKQFPAALVKTTTDSF